MKTTLSTLLLLLLFGQFVNGQCERKGTFVAIADPVNYPISGTATLESLQDGSKKVNFDMFSTVQGKVLHTFLSVDENYNPGVDLQISDRELYVDEINNIKGTLRDPISGPRSFNVPSTVEFDEYNYVIVYCISASALWGRAKLENSTGAGCNTLSTERFTTEELRVFPNPVTDQLHINLKSLSSASFKIFTLHGQLVKTVAATNRTNSQIDVSNIESGLYLLEISSNNKVGYQRLLVN